MFVWDLPRRHLVFWWTRVFAVFFSISPTGKQHINTETSMGNFPVRESLCVCPTTPAGLLRDVSQKKKDSNRNLITFVFLSTANIMWGKRLNLVVFFSLLFILFYFLFNHLSFQIVVLEKEILQAESKPGKFPPPPPEWQARSVFMVLGNANWLCRRPFPTVTHDANGLSPHPEVTASL